MKSIFSSLRKSLKKVPEKKSLRANMAMEPLEARELMTATPITPPKSLLIYYGYPSDINGASSTPQAAATFGKYADVVLGDGIESPTHPDHANTQAILSNASLAHTMVFGYVDMGVSTQNLSVSQMETDINLWKAMGVKGIFLDDFGYDFGTTRIRQDTIVQYAHGQGLTVMANAFNPVDAFGSQSNANNPTGLATALNANDSYLYEDYQLLEGNYVPASDWLSKASTLASYQSAIGFKVMAVTTNNATNAFNQNEFNYAYDAAFQAGYTAIGWGDYDYGADTSRITLITPPSLNAGTTFTSAVNVNGVNVTRNTNLGQIVINDATHICSFTPQTTAPTLNAVMSSAKQVQLTWNAVSGATSYTVSMKNGQSAWTYYATVPANQNSQSIPSLKPGTTYSFEVIANFSTTSMTSNTVSVTTPATANLTPPSTLTLTALSSTLLQLQWNTVSSATNYNWTFANIMNAKSPYWVLLSALCITYLA